MKTHTGAIDWLTAIAFGLLLAALWAGYQWAYSKGYDARAEIAIQDDDARVLATAKAANKEGQASRQADKRLREEAATLTNQLKESQDHAARLQTSLDRALRTGDQRLSIRTTSCKPAAVPADRAAQHAAPGPQEARAELHTEDAANLAAITADAEQATRELNHCIDRYDAARDALAAWKATIWKGATDVETPKSAQTH